ncbi:MAG: acyl-CoA dehydrogenase family protein [Betaproteobacteria bacterium]|nr:acyl-CoA dehydrogenase family protein [Betaproteobacteria bacterium]
MTAIAYEYSPEIVEIRKGIEKFIKVEVIPRHENNARLFEIPHKTYTEDGRYSPDVLRLISEVRQAASKAGYYNMCAPESIGGQGLGHVAWFAGWEQIFHQCAENYWIGHFAMGHWAYGPSPVLTRLTDEAKQRFLPGLIAGTHSLCFGMSEPGAGSDAMMMQTRAKSDGTGWLLNGSKIWTTNSPYADYCIVFAVTDPEAAAQRKRGISAFLVPTNSPGFVIQRVIRMWDSAGGNEAVLHFDNVRVEPWQMVGELHNGFSIAMLGVNLGRIYNTARAVGMGRWALEKAFDYIKIRKTFGKPISEYQGVTFPLAESAMHIHAAHLMALNVSQLLDKGLPARKELSMTKGFATQMAAMAIDRAIQAHGAIGVTSELGLTEAYKTLRMVNIADGTNEILRRTIAQEMLAGDTDL